MEYRSKTYALLNRGDKRLFRQVIRYLDPRPEDKILEIGCGRGFLTRRVQEICPETYGIDINLEAISHGVTRNLQVMSAEELEFDDESFDKLCSCHVIEHIPDLKGALQEMERVLRPGGRLLLVYPLEPVRGLFSIPAAIAIFKNPFRAREIHVHKLFPSTIKKLIESSRLEYVLSRFYFFSTPQFFTVLRKHL